MGLRRLAHGRPGGRRRRRRRGRRPRPRTASDDSSSRTADRVVTVPPSAWAFAHERLEGGVGRGLAHDGGAVAVVEQGVAGDGDDHDGRGRHDRRARRWTCGGRPAARPRATASSCAPARRPGAAAASGRRPARGARGSAGGLVRRLGVEGRLEARPEVVVVRRDREQLEGGADDAIGLDGGLASVRRPAHRTSSPRMRRSAARAGAVGRRRCRARRRGSWRPRGGRSPRRRRARR